MTKEKRQISFSNMVRVSLDSLKKVLRSWVKKSSSDLKEESDKSCSPDLYFISINELPLDCWVKCTDGDLTQLRKGTKGDPQMDSIAWEMVYDDYIKKFGLGKLYKKLLEAMIRKAKAELDFCISGNRLKLTTAEIEEQRIETMMRNKGSGMTISQTLIHLSKWIGHWLNIKELKTQEYFDLLSEFEKHNKAQKDG